MICGGLWAQWLAVVVVVVGAAVAVGVVGVGVVGSGIGGVGLPRRPPRHFVAVAA